MTSKFDMGNARLSNWTLEYYTCYNIRESQWNSRCLVTGLMGDRRLYQSPRHLQQAGWTLAPQQR